MILLTTQTHEIVTKGHFFSFRHLIASEAIHLYQMKLVAYSNTKKIYIKGGK